MPLDLITNILNDETIKKQIIDNCLAINFVEACGLICLEKDNTITVVKAINTSLEPFSNFLISGTFIRKVLEEKEIIGYYHSHDSGSANPSIEDLAVINKLNLNCIIYDKKSKTITETRPSIQDFIPQYDGRPFIAGLLDCSELVRDYYMKALNIKLPKLNHPIKFQSWDEIKENWNSLQDYNKSDYLFFLNYFLDNGFYEIETENLIKNDIILLRTIEIKAPIHALIYMGNDKILHHPSNKLSEYNYYTNVYKRLTVKAVRYGE